MRRTFCSAMLGCGLLMLSLQAAAIDRIRLRAAEVTAAGVAVPQVDATLEITSATHSKLTATTGPLPLPPAVEAQTGVISGMQLSCRDPLVHEPQFGCPALQLRLRTARLSNLVVNARVNYHSARGTLQASGNGPTLQGLTPRFDLNANGAKWQAQVQLPQAPVESWIKLLQPWLTLPKDLTFSGQAKLALKAQGEGAAMRGEAEVSLTEAGFQNEAFTWIGEKLALTAKVQADLTREPLGFELALTGEHGQALAGPVLLDFDRNPLQLTMRGKYTPQTLRIEALDSRQKDLAQVTGSAEISLMPVAIVTAELDAREVRFPSAYASYMQLALTTTPFNQLKTAGTASLKMRVANNQPVELAMTVDNLTFSDEAQQLEVAGVNAAVNWAAGNAAPEQPSWLAWESARGWGITGTKTRLEFATHDRNFRLLQAARLPFFDGALRINRFAVQKIGDADMSGEFDAFIEPISIAPIAKALGWPEFGGTLSGSIPGLSYGNKELSVQGDIEAQAFDGRIVARNLRVRDPFSDWPKIYADITARNLDLGLITSIFEFGGISGRLDVDVLGLETFGLTPTAFDLKLGTPPGDKSRHRISQRAVESLSSMGGGGAGGVAAALQSGFLKFFDEFGYERIGLSCRLRNDVCRMSGTGPAPNNGFYIVRGSGTPRIDIIGNNERVAWPQFISQVVDALSNPGEIDVR